MILALKRLNSYFKAYRILVSQFQNKIDEIKNEIRKNIRLENLILKNLNDLVPYKIVRKNNQNRKRDFVWTAVKSLKIIIKNVPE